MPPEERINIKEIKKLNTIEKIGEVAGSFCQDLLMGWNNFALNFEGNI